MVDGPVQVAVEDHPLRPRFRRSPSGESPGDDLGDIALEGHVGLPVDGGPVAAQQVPQADGRFLRSPFVEAHRSHAQRDDAPGAGMGGGSVRRDRAGEEEAACPGAGVHRSTHQVPRRRVALPLVDEDRLGAPRQTVRVGPHQCERLGVVQIMDGAGATPGGPRLADSAGTLDADGGQSIEQQVQLLVHNTPAIRTPVGFGHRPALLLAAWSRCSASYSTVSRIGTLLMLIYLHC